jgi:hypothetical protein
MNYKYFLFTTSITAMNKCDKYMDIGSLQQEKLRNLMDFLHIISKEQLSPTLIKLESKRKRFLILLYNLQEHKIWARNSKILDVLIKNVEDWELILKEIIKLYKLYETNQINEKYFLQQIINFIKNNIILMKRQLQQIDFKTEEDENLIEVYLWILDLLIICLEYAQNKSLPLEEMIDYCNFVLSFITTSTSVHSYYQKEPPVESCISPNLLRIQQNNIQ